MTFTEAAVEVLRRAGKPLHFKDIAELAVRENMLSHVGQDPEVTMGQRLAAMAKREDDRKVVAVAPDGTFALTEWSVPAEQVVEPKAPSLIPEGAELEAPYRAREREPRPINAQARRRMEALAGHETEEPERPERPERGDRDDHRRDRGGQRRFPPPAEVVFEALALRQSGAPLAELAAELLQKGLLSDALVTDLPSLTAALLEDNRRRTEAGRKPAFIVDATSERVTLVEFPPASALPFLGDEKDRAPASAQGRPPTAVSLVAEFRRATVRALRRRLAEQETAGFEHVCAALLEKMGMRDVRVAKRSKEGPLYLARQRRGVSDLRVAVRLVRGAREISRQDVQELRKDLAHYSAQMGLVLAPGEAGREARAEASSAGQPPVALYAGEALAEELVSLRVGVSVQTVELADVDESFFAGAARAAPGHRASAEERKERPPREGRERGQEQKEAAPAEAEEKQAAEAERAEGEAAPVAAEEESESARAADAPSAPPAAEPVREASAAAVEPESRDEAEASPDGERGRGRRGGRGRERPERSEPPARLASPADQAWGQPAGTPRKAAPQGPYPLTQDPARASDASDASMDVAAEAPLDAPLEAAKGPSDAPASDEPGNAGA